MRLLALKHSDSDTPIRHALEFRTTAVSSYSPPPPLPTSLQILSPSYYIHYKLYTLHTQTDAILLYLIWLAAISLESENFMNEDPLDTFNCNMWRLQCWEGCQYFLQIASLQHSADTQYYELWLIIEDLTDFLVSGQPIFCFREDRMGRART